ncbi:MAG: ribosome silencing factor [Actinomycetia bacterium]|nr:ribosome silencing factor [Actinomycetes bacterium]MCH9802124.1 ribosome silencing factor [Actinomycetes bacterium]
MTAEPIAVEWAQLAAAAAAEKKATDIVAFDVSDVLVITDVFVVCTAANQPQLTAIMGEVEKRLKEAGAEPVRREGQRQGSWMLLDFVDLVVHVQLPEARSMYDLERLWRDRPQLELPDVIVVE